MPIFYLETSAGRIPYDTVPTKNRSELQNNGNDLKAQVESIRRLLNDHVVNDSRDGNQPSHELDIQVLQLMLRFIIHDEVHGSSETIDKRKATLFNVFLTAGLLSKYRPYSLSNLYKHIYTGGEYGYSIWDAMEFCAHVFLVPTNQPLNRLIVNLPPEALDIFLQRELPIIKEIILTELSNNHANKNQLRQQYIANPIHNLPILFSYFSFYKDYAFIQKILNLSEPTLLNSLSWANPEDKQSILGLAEHMGEFLQEQHLSRVSRSLFAEQDLQTLRELRNKLEHIEENSGIFSQDYHQQDLNNLRKIFLLINSRLSIIWKRILNNQQNILSPSHKNIMNYISRYYIRGERLTRMQVSHIIDKIPLLTTDAELLSLRESAKKFCKWKFRHRCTEKLEEKVLRFRNELQVYVDFAMLPNRLKQYIFPAIQELRKQLSSPSLNSNDLDQFHRVLARPINLSIIRQINVTRRALVNCLTKLPHYQDYFHARDVSFPQMVNILDFYPSDLVRRPNLLAEIVQNQTYQDHMRTLRNMDVSFAQKCSIFCPDHIAIPRVNEQLLGLGAQINMPDQTRQIWRQCIVASIEFIQFKILCIELESNKKLQHAIRYTTKALSQLLESNTYIRERLLPEELQAELVSMRNVYAHSNAYVDKAISLVGEAPFLIGYASLLLIDILPEELHPGYLL